MRPSSFKHFSTILCKLLSIVFLLGLSSAVVNNLCAQDLKVDTRSKSVKDDQVNKYQADEIETLDILKALEVLGVRIHKSDLGMFDSDQELTLIIEEYWDQGRISSDTVTSFSNTYHYWEVGNDEPFLDYIRTLDLTTKQDNNVLDLRFETPSFQQGTRISLEVERENQFYQVRFYEETRWAEDQFVPLFIFGSSWTDDRFEGMERFCGASKLRKGDPGTIELLESSKHYFIIGYSCRKNNG